MPRLTVGTYNTFQERKGRDPALDALLGEEALVCLQEVKPTRAMGIKRALGSRAYVSPAKYGLLYLVLVLPEGVRFLERRAASLNGHGGVLPAFLSLRRSYELLRAGKPAWKDGLEPRVAQVARVAWDSREFRVINTHLPLEPGLRNRCLDVLKGLVGEGDVLLAGDLNATTQNPRYRPQDRLCSRPRGLPRGWI
jgi:endonuclease/exonuclease/phosphatase family metal-dependent hydrolase